MKIKPNFFTKKSEEGDMCWMVKRPEYENYLFIFNDNEEHYHTFIKGGGNACLRPFKKTGHVWGFQQA